MWPFSRRIAVVNSSATEAGYVSVVAVVDEGTELLQLAWLLPGDAASFRVPRWPVTLKLAIQYEGGATASVTTQGAEEVTFALRPGATDAFGDAGPGSNTPRFSSGPRPPPPLFSPGPRPHRAPGN